MTQVNNPKHQHYIPRAYLKHFARHVKKKRFVEVVNTDSGEKLHVSTKDICVKSGLYTLPDLPDTEPYDLEKYYAKHVDEVYPEVYELLTDKSKVIISNNQKHKIIYTVLSMYFRTPKLLNKHNEIFDRLIDRALRMTDPTKDEIKMDIEGRKLIFLRSEAQDIKIKLREENREVFIATHLQLWHEFVAYKYDCAISLFEVEGDIELITSDNPVSIHSSVQNPFNLFDPTNIIEIPLDRKHYLLIYPNTEAPQRNIINRGKRDKYFALTTNLSTQRNAENWVIGFPDTVVKHFVDQQKFGEHTPENLQIVEMMKQRAELMNKLLEIMQKNGFLSTPVAQKIKEYKILECFKDNHDIEEMARELEQNGFETS